VRRQFERWRALTGAERILLVYIVLLLPLVGLGLKLLGYRRVRDTLAWWVPRSAVSSRGPGPGSDQDVAERLSRLVSIAANRGPYRANCLRQSLVLWWLLRRRGISGELRFGVRKEGEGVQAHAWVELDGFPLNDAAGVSAAYAPFASDLNSR
jgi:hypothetical protein